MRYFLCNGNASFEIAMFSRFIVQELRVDASTTLHENKVWYCKLGLVGEMAMYQVIGLRCEDSNITRRICLQHQRHSKCLNIDLVDFYNFMV